MAESIVYSSGPSDPEVPFDAFCGEVLSLRHNYMLVALSATLVLVIGLATSHLAGSLPAHSSVAHAAGRSLLPRVAPAIDLATPRVRIHVQHVHKLHTAPLIALTFDDGPSPYYTTQILQTLQHFGIHATFFVVGREVAAYPGIVRAVAAGGNEIEDHTWDHADLTRLSLESATTEIASTADEVLLLTGRAPRYMRPPYGHANATVRAEAAAMGEDTVLWNVDPRDWALPGIWYIQNTVLANARNRALVIMHDGGGRRDETVAALQTIIPALKARGFRFVTVQQLLDPLAPAAPPLSDPGSKGPLAASPPLARGAQSGIVPSGGTSGDGK